MNFKVFLAICSFSIFFISCKENGNNGPESKTEIERKTPEISENPGITAGQVGIFKLGMPIPDSIPDDLQIKKEKQTRFTESGPTEEIIYVVSKNDTSLLILKLGNEKDTVPKIAEIMLLSKKYKTREGIGVDSTLEDFIKAYPDFKIWYTYVSDRFILETAELPAQFLLLEEDFIGEMEINDVQVPLKITDFKEGARIKKIRLF